MKHIKRNRRSGEEEKESQDDQEARFVPFGLDRFATIAISGR